MNQHVRVLMVEDSDDDAALLLRELKRGRINAISARVDTKRAFLQALDEREWDLILCDYSMPHFSGPEALHIVQEREMDIPFIYVSGTMGEDIAVEAMRSGAHDYVMKGHLKRLVPAIERELKDALQRRERKAAQMKLQETKQRLREIIEHSTNMFYTHTPEHVLTYVSPQSRDFFDCEPEEAMVRWTEFLTDHPVNQEGMRSTELAIQTGKAQPPYELQLRGKKGRVIWCRVNEAPIVRNGETVAIAGSLTNISESKQAMDQLRESEERFRALIENNSDIIARVDERGTILYHSSSAGRVLGYSSEEVMGTNAFAFVHPADRTKVSGQFADLVATAGKIMTATFRARHKDGSWRWLQTTGQNLLDNPAVQAVVLNYHDVTEEHIARESLNESLLKLKELEFIINESPAIAFLWRASEGWPVEYVSENISRLGYTVQEFTSGMIPYAKIVHPLDLDRVSEEVQRYTRERREEFRQEYRVLTKNGTICWLEDQTWVRRDAGGTVTHYQGIVTDITDRKRAEEALVESENRYREVVENAPEVIFTTDANGYFQYVNTAGQKLSGYSSQELRGLRFTDLVADEYKRNVKTAHYRQFLTRTSNIYSEYPFRTKQGDVVWLAQNSQLILGDGEVRGFHVISRDITAQKKAEEALRLSEERLSAFLGASRDAIIVEHGHTIAFINKAGLDLYGFDTAEELIGQPVSIIQAEQSRAMMQEYGRLRLEGKPAPTLYEFKGQRKDGTELDLEASVSVTTIVNRPHIISVVRNISERRRLEEERRNLQVQIIQAQKMESIGTLAGGIAHDFNNILAIILGHVGVLESKKVDAFRQEQSVDAIAKATRRGADLVKQILTFARKTDSLLESVDVNSIVHEIQKLLRETFPRSIEILFDQKTDLPLITADQTQIHQAILNLAVNARDAMPRGGVLTISTSTVPASSVSTKIDAGHVEQYVVIAVRDTGSGMSEETLQHVFEPFFTTKEKGKGTGLGLAVTYGVVKGHAGHIEVESQPAKGTTFRLFFPVNAPDPRDLTVQKTYESIQGGTETILVVEDESMLLEVVSSILERQGYRLIKATDGREAVVLYEKHAREIDLVLSDLGLPGLGGTEILEKMKSINPSVKAVVATGYLEPEMRSELLKNGAKAILMKPYRQNELLQNIRKVLDDNDRIMNASFDLSESNADKG